MRKIKKPQAFTPLATPEELDHHLMASRTPFTLHFTSPKPNAAKPSKSPCAGRTNAAFVASGASISQRWFREGNVGNYVMTAIFLLLISEKMLY
jgi:hypothetical protein